MSETIIENIYPLTVTADRYSGAYSGGKFTAWNLEPSEIPDGVFSDDVGCWDFWETNNIVCGKGDTIEEAIGNLYMALKETHDE